MIRMSFIFPIILATLVEISIQSKEYCSKDDVGCMNDDEGSTLFGIDHLPRREPGEVGDVNEVEFDDGRIQSVVTRAINPPMFELPDFITEAECDHVISAAKSTGLGQGGTFGGEGINRENIEVRQSAVTFISADNDPVLQRIQERIMKLTGLPSELIKNKENFQVAMYPESGFYKFHYDSGPEFRDILLQKPCCQHVEPPISTTKCSHCRYITVLMYLNDVEEGGETAFPLADLEDQTFHDDPNDFSFSCQSAQTTVEAIKGNAVMWYNNIIDPELGWLGVRDE